MKAKIISVLSILIVLSASVQAHECYNKDIPSKPSFIQQKKMDNLLNERLQLTQEQQEQLRKNRSESRKEMEKIIKEMKKKHEAIRNVYLSGIPKFQADVKTAPYKAELVILKQNANKLRQKNRKNFESILTTEQKAEFQILRQEFSKKHHNKEAKEIN